MGGFKLGKMTLGSLFKQPETVLYPLEQKAAPAGRKGTITLLPETCILCGICEKRCPCNAITVQKKERTWAINHFQCVQCGYCVSECPKKSLAMDPEFWVQMREEIQDHAPCQVVPDYSSSTGGPA